MITPRPYQQESIDIGYSFMTDKGGKRGGLQVLPTGSGKSITIAGIAMKLGEPLLVFQPSVEILYQNYHKLRAFGYGHAPAIYSAKAGKKQIAPITFATIGSAINNFDLFKDFRYIIIDEAHLVNSEGITRGDHENMSMFASFISRLNKPKVIGLTATPYRLASNRMGSEMRFLTRTKEKMFDDLIYYVQRRALFEMGYLAPMNYYAMPDGIDPSKMKLNSTGSDFEKRSYREHTHDIHLPDKAADIANRMLKKRNSLLVFTRFVEEAHEIAMQVPGMVVITGETHKDERKEMVDAFKAGQIRSVANVGTMTTGFDHPALDGILVARDMMSLSLWDQMVGRGARPHPSKTECWVTDLGKNIARFGHMYDQEITKDHKGHWVVRSRGRQLTNVIFGKNQMRKQAHATNPS
jgi:DNA repair protein RadD